MKKKNIELDVDFIGTQPSKLTEEEKKAISEYIKADKAKRAKKKERRNPASKKQKA